MRGNRIKSNQFCIAFLELVLRLLNGVQLQTWTHYSAIEERLQDQNCLPW